MSTTLRGMCREWLKAHGHDGLYNEIGECGCDLNDLMICGCPNDMCVAASKADCSRCRRGPNHANDCEYNDIEATYMMFAGASIACSPDYADERKEGEI